MLFFLQLPDAKSQRMETIPGTYTFEEEIGIHYYAMPQSTYASTPKYADTTVLHNLCLNATHGAFLERDTSLSIYSIDVIRDQWIGNWQLNNDSLIITLDHRISFYPFSIQGSPSTIVEKLPEPIIMVLLVDEFESVIYWMRYPDQGACIFQKEE